MRRTMIGMSVTVVLGLSIQVAAETSAEDAYEYREHVMTAVKGHAGALSMQTRGLAGAPDDVAKHAAAMAALAGELKTVFPEGSDYEESEALPEIWDEPEAFAEALAKIEQATTALSEVAREGDMREIGGAFRDVGQACKGCHDRFREEHDH